MFILGINAFHGGASASLIRDGRLIAAAEEERFVRKKYWAGFPVRAINYVLGEAGIRPEELDHIGISRDPSANLVGKALFAFTHRPDLKLVQDQLNNNLKVGNLKSIFCERIGVKANNLKAQFHNIEHHRAHMASAFFVSPFEQAAILSVDGAGDFVSTMWGSGKDACLDVSSEINFPHSLGIFYSAITQWLGFPSYGDEGKVMGLAPYGEPAYLDKMRRIVRVQRDGTFELDLDFFLHHAKGATMTWNDGSPHLGTLYSDKLIESFGEPRAPRSELTKHQMDVAASLQAMLEEAELALVQRIQEDTGQTVICMAGGVALNSAFNGKILPQTSFDDIYIQPASGDAGTALGVCYYIYHQILGQPRSFIMQGPDTGPHYSNDEIETVLNQHSLSHTAMDERALVEQAADVIAEGNILGWFQGRMEWGPRALGNRSILANPCRADTKDILNARVKHREMFRPFAPSILLEDVGDYFDQTYPDPFMTKIYNVVPDKRQSIPAVTHIDGTGRPQTVDQTYMPLYWCLIDAFKQRTGVPVVLNTSFNENEPIVCTPEEAVDCFLRTKMDVLIIGNYLVRKQ